MSWDCEQIPLEDERYFETLNGLWKGEEEPLTEVGVIRNTNFNESGTIDYSNIAWLPVEVKKFRDRRLISGDVIIERSGGGPNRPVGRVVYFDREDGQYCFSNFTSAIRVKNADAFDHKFVFYGLMDLYQSGQTEDLQRQTTNIRNLDFTGFKERAKFPLLKLTEQKRIAQVLSTVQAAIEQQERLIRTTTELKQALMQKLFTEGLRGEAQKETEIGAVPESWEVVRLDEVMNCHDGKRRPVTQSDRIPGPYPYYGASGVTDHVEGYLFNGDYLLIAEDGENLASRKLPIAFIARGKFWVNNHAHVLSMKEGNLAFYEQYIAQMEIKDYLSGTTRPKLNKGLMMTMKLPWPSVEEQNEIAAALGACDTKRRSAEHKMNTLQALFRTLLHELMTGKVRVGE